MNRERGSILMLIMALMVILSFSVSAEQQKTLTGHMEGLNCILYGNLCPVDELDPRIDLETDFVLYLDSGEYYLLPNIPRSVKAKYIGKAIRVTGEVNIKYKAVTVDNLELKRAGGYRIVWSKWSQVDPWQEWKEDFFDGETSH
jgi:hypothetical protein